MDSNDTLKFVRKLQKKLRQIERLEQSPRDLNEEEENKVHQKNVIRNKLQDVLNVLKAANISFESDLQNTSVEEDYDDIEPETPIPVKEQPKDNDDEVEESEQNFNKENARSISPSCPVSESKRWKLNDGMESKVFENESAATTVNEIPVEVSQIESDVKKEAGDGKSKSKKKTKSMQSKLRKAWRQMKFSVRHLEGHNYTVTSVDSCDTWAVSGSKDTSVKLWDLKTEGEIRNLTGHTGSVTCVKLIPLSQSENIRKHIECSNPEHNIDISDAQYASNTFVLSGSHDCSIRFWLVPTGLCIKSLYTYSPVATFTVLNDVQFIFVCSDTGKLTVFDLITGESVLEKKIHNDYVKTVDIKHNKLATASLDGEFKIWEVSAIAGRFENVHGRFERETQCSLKLVYVFENDEKCPIYTNVLYRNLMYFGTEGANLRVYDTMSGSKDIRKLRNHSMNFGFSDSLAVINDVLVSSSYDLNTGKGSINIRSLNEECFEIYLATLSHELVSRVLAMTAIEIDGQKCILVGGENLVLFKEVQEPEISPDIEIVFPQVFTNLRKEVIDSDAESDTSDGSEVQGSWFWKKSEKSVIQTEEQAENSSSDSASEDEESKREELDDSTSSWRCSIL